MNETEILLTFAELSAALLEFYESIEDLMEYSAKEIDDDNERIKNSIAVYKNVGSKAKQVEKVANDIREYHKSVINLTVAKTGKLKWKTDAGSATVGAPTIRGSVKQAKELNYFLNQEGLLLVAADGEKFNVIGPASEILGEWITIRQQAGGLTIR